VTRLAYLFADLPVELLGRLRSDQVMLLPAPPRRPGTNGRPRKHGGELALAAPATWPAPQITTSTVTSRYGSAVTAACPAGANLLRAAMPAESEAAGAALRPRHEDREPPVGGQQAASRRYGQESGGYGRDVSGLGQSDGSEDRLGAPIAPSHANERSYLSPAGAATTGSWRGRTPTGTLGSLPFRMYHLLTIPVTWTTSRMLCRGPRLAASYT
jgi:DDE superfamily endonuclease